MRRIHVGRHFLGKTVSRKKKKKKKKKGSLPSFFVRLQAPGDEDGGAVLRSRGVPEEAFDNRNIHRYSSVRSSDLAGRDDRPGDRMVVEAAVDGARLPGPPKQVPFPLDGSAGIRCSPPLVRLHGALRFLSLSQDLVQF